MEYDPVKDKLQSLLGHSTLARWLFFAVMDRVFLRSRYVARELQRLRRSGFLPLAILDAGSGFGQYSFRLARSFPQAQVLGLDVKQDYVEAANQYARAAGLTTLTFTVGNLLELQEQSQFDLILSVDVMEHIEADEEVFANLGQALKPEGLFIMTTPYFAGTNTKSEKPKVFIDEHVRPGYSREELKAKLALGGMELEQFVITYGPYGNLAWQLLQRGPMRWLSRHPGLTPIIALYFCLIYPVAWLFMQVDLSVKNSEGGGILAVARKKP